MKQFLTICLSLLISVIHAQTSSDIKLYITKYKEIALDHEKKYGIPASITLAQGILESGAGKSMLTVNANNHFGIKAGNSWEGSVYLAWDDEINKSRFRKYSSANESFDDHAKVLRGSRYSSLFAKSIYDYRAWAYGLQKAGYATATNYAKALIGYIDAYKLYSINGGVKLKPGKTITITKYITKEQPVFDADCLIEDEVQTEEEEFIKRTINRYVVEINDVRCTLLYPGESITSISMKYDIPKEKILEYNEVINDANIKEGDIVFLEKKKAKYNGSRDYYNVKENETLYEISQQFGIRMANLAKMNGIDLFTKLKVGRKLKLK